MMKRFLNWLKSTFSPRKEPPRRDLRQTGTHLRKTAGPRSRVAPIRKQVPPPRRHPKPVDTGPKHAGRVEEVGPGKTVLIRNKYVREDKGTHDTLKIMDDSLIETDEETGIDPYNTGQFDRSKNWDKRFRK